MINKQSALFSNLSFGIAMLVSVLLILLMNYPGLFYGFIFIKNPNEYQYQQGPHESFSMSPADIHNLLNFGLAYLVLSFISFIGIIFAVVGFVKKERLLILRTIGIIINGIIFTPVFTPVFLSIFTK